MQTPEKIREAIMRKFRIEGKGGKRSKFQENGNHNGPYNFTSIKGIS